VYIFLRNRNIKVEGGVCGEGREGQGAGRGVERGQGGVWRGVCGEGVGRDVVRGCRERVRPCGERVHGGRLISQCTSS
jgi:hypothetical protein